MAVKQTKEDISPCNFDAILAREYASIRARRAAAKIDAPLESGTTESPPADLFGVSLSGGEIRSASYCLGAGTLPYSSMGRDLLLDELVRKLNAQRIVTAG